MNTCRELVRLAARADSGILITSYEQLRRQRAALVGVHWGYVVLDEGHKIRNPDAEVTLAAKQLPTVSHGTGGFALFISPLVRQQPAVGLLCEPCTRQCASGEAGLALGLRGPGRGAQDPPPRR